MLGFSFSLQRLFFRKSQNRHMLEVGPIDFTRYDINDKEFLAVALCRQIYGRLRAWGLNSLLAGVRQPDYSVQLEKRQVAGSISRKWIYLNDARLSSAGSVRVTLNINTHGLWLALIFLSEQEAWGKLYQVLNSSPQRWKKVSKK